MTVKAFETDTHALLYVQLVDGSRITHFTFDAKWDVYVRVRETQPDRVILFDTKKDLREKLKELNYFL